MAGTFQSHHLGDRQPLHIQLRPLLARWPDSRAKTVRSVGLDELIKELRMRTRFRWWGPNRALFTLAGTAMISSGFPQQRIRMADSAPEYTV